MMLGILSWYLAIRPTTSSPVASTATTDDEPRDPLRESPTPATCPTVGYSATTKADPLWYVPSATTAVDWDIVYRNNWPLGGKYEYTFMFVKTTRNEDPATATSYPHVFHRTRATNYVTVATYTDMADEACVTVEHGLDSKTVTDTFTAYATDPALYMDASATDFAQVACPGVVQGKIDGGLAKEDMEKEEGQEDCVAREMDTACIGQCVLGGANGQFFICQQDTHDQTQDLSMGLGRVCWAPNGTMHALHSPCLKEDHGVGCIPGKADYRPFRPSKWV